MRSFVVVAVGIVYIFPFPLTEIIPFVVVVAAAVHIVQCIQSHFEEKNESVSEVTHTFYYMSIAMMTALNLTIFVL